MPAVSTTNVIPIDTTKRIETLVRRFSMFGRVKKFSWVSEERRRCTRAARAPPRTGSPPTTRPPRDRAARCLRGSTVASRGHSWPPAKCAIRASVASSRESDATIRPRNMTTIRSQSRRSSGISDDDTRIPIPSLRGTEEEPVDLRLGADVDATGRLVEHQDARTHSRATSRARPSAGSRRRGSRRRRPANWP